MNNFERVVMLVACAIIGNFIVVGSIAIAQMNNRIEEQNKILKEMVVCMQEQNNILKYNPMEEEK